MFSNPIFFQDLLSHTNHIDEIYSAMKKDDHSEVVMKALDVLRETDTLPCIMIYHKSEERSTNIRNHGNDQYKSGNYQRAFKLYNQALLFAPKDSREMKLAYSNRSALLYKLKLWKQCEIDIERCFKMGCPTDILEKLMKRKESANSYVEMDVIQQSKLLQTIQKVVNYDIILNNTQISCATSDIKVVKSIIPKVVASNDIKIGTIITSEKAYVSYTDYDCSLFSCHFCQKQSLNLIPCDGCCYVLFCDEDCQKRCLEEYHVYECQIMDVITALCKDPILSLMVKASLKLRTTCKSWKELIDASYNVGLKQMKSTPVQEIYDNKNIYSVLSSLDTRPFIYGKLYNKSFVCATIIHYIEKQIPSFFPTNIDEKQQALKGLGRIMAFMSLYLLPLQLVQAHRNIKLESDNFARENYGLFPFTEKLKLSCKPNLIILNNNNKLILYSIRPIKSGEELTVGNILQNHVYAIDKMKRLYDIQSFQSRGTVNNCSRCENKCSFSDKKLSKVQNTFFYRLNLSKLDKSMCKYDHLDFVYHKLLKALEVLKDVQDSKEYVEIYIRFSTCILFLETVYNANIKLDDTN